MTKEERMIFIRETIERHIGGSRVSWSPNLLREIADRWEKDVDDALIEYGRLRKL